MSPRSLPLLLCLLALVGPLQADELPEEFLRTYCHDCHAGAEAAGGLDLPALSRDLAGIDTFGRWVKIHDRIATGEMPPPDGEQPPAEKRTAATKVLHQRLIAAEQARYEREGRTPVRRLTRVEYEQTIRDLLALPGISLQAGLPEDGSAHGFDKNSDALDISHVNLAKYLEAADKALDMAIAVQPYPPRRQTHRMSLAPHINHILMNGDAVMLRDGKADTEFTPGAELRHVGPIEHGQLARTSLRRQASVGVFRHEDESFKPYFYDFAALYPGRYRIRTSFWSFQWDQGKVLPARGTEAARLSVVQLQDDGRGGGHPSYILGYYDAPSLSPQVHEVETWLNFKDTIGFNTASLAPVANYNRPGRAMAFTGPGIACDWFEIEGPIHDSWPPVGHRRLFGDLPIVAFDAKNQPGIRPPRRQLIRQETQAPNRPDPPSGNWTVASAWPEADADRLLASFLPRAFRRPVEKEVRQQYLALVTGRLSAGDSFESAMRYAYRAALCSPDFLYLTERPDPFDDDALAARLSYFLWGSLPDDTLTQLARAGKLRTKKTLDEEVERLLNDPKSERFIDDFLGQWLNLRKIAANDPDRNLYPEFSPYLQDSMIAETHAYFREMLDKDLDARHLVKSDFAMLNEKLATLYGVPGVSGSSIRRVALPEGCPRGPLLTQASVLKVTANGTTTSPVPRGAFVMSRFLGQTPEPPPPNIAAVEPDVQGATTIREQLDKHRSVSACAGCHAKMDPPGFALEAFDVIGGERARYRSIGEGDPAPRGAIDPFISIRFKLGQPVDASGTLPDGRSFAGIREFQTLLAAEPRPLLTNLAEQLCVYATGRPIGFGDRGEIAALVDRTERQGGGIRTLLHELVKSRLFLAGDLAAAAPPAAVAAVPDTPTRAAPPLPATPEPTTDDVEPNQAEERLPRPTVHYRLIGLSSAENVADLRNYLETLPEMQLVDVDPAKHEIALSYDLARLFPRGAANQKYSADQIREQMSMALRRVSRGLFQLKPLLGESRGSLIRDTLDVNIPDCRACRLCVYQAAIKVDGVEQAEIDLETDRLTVWMTPDKADLAPIRAALVKARVELPAE